MTSSSPILQLRGAMSPAVEAIWTPDAARFVGDLVARFTQRRDELLMARLDAGFSAAHGRYS
jgi:malate synthase